MKSSFGGRPKIPGEQLRDQRVVTFLTGEERINLKKIAENANISISKACHDLILRGMHQLDTPPPDTRSKQRVKK